MKFNQPFRGVPNGGIYPVEYVKGDECPPELEAAAVEASAADGERATRQDGPTLREFLDAGYKASAYPPAGYAARNTAEEIAAAVAAERAGDIEQLTVVEIKALLDQAEIAYKSGATKAELVALLPVA